MNSKKRPREETIKKVEVKKSKPSNTKPISSKNVPKSKPSTKEVKKAPTKIESTPKKRPISLPVKVEIQKDDKLMVGDTIFIRKFPMFTEDNPINTKRDGKRVLIIGGSGCGKSTVALEIVKANKDIPVWMVVSPSESRNHTFGNFMHPLWLHDNLVLEELEQFRKRQEERVEKWQIPNTKPPQYRRDPSAGLILDDCMITPKLFKDDIFNYLYFNSRHDKVLFMMLTQYFMVIPIQHRRNLSHVVMFKNGALKEIRKLYEEFAVLFPTFGDFRRALEICTQERRCMIIDNMNPSTNLTDKVFWYKSLPQEEQTGWRAGADWAYVQSDKIYNEDWKQDLKRKKEEDAQEQLNQPKNKRGKIGLDELKVKLLNEDSELVE